MAPGPLPVAYYGPVVNPVDLTSYKALPRCLIGVSASGEIQWIVEDVPDSMVQNTLAEHGYLDVDVFILRSGEFLLPGFVDTHTHAPQLPNIGSGQQYELLEWLQKITFPMEARFGDENFAWKTYKSVVRTKINCGTTTCCYYGSLHLEATKILADLVHSSGQRGFVGKCNMNREAADFYVEESAEISLADTKEIVSYIRSLPTLIPNDPLVRPILTPRFAISCTDDLLYSLGSMAKADPELHIQTHISENTAEVAFTKILFPSCKTYAGVYDKFGLLRHNTVLAHAVHLEEEEIALIAQRHAGISHCPTSNFNLSSGVAPIGHYLDRGIKVGLGTDVSGGFSPSILSAIQHASIASKILAMHSVASQHVHTSVRRFADRQLSVATLLYLATMGGAEVCDLADRIGSFVPGKSFDALVVNVRKDAGNIGLWGSNLGDQPEGLTESQLLEGMLERFLFCGDDRNIQRVLVQGRAIGGTSLPL